MTVILSAGIAIAGGEDLDFKGFPSEITGDTDMDHAGILNDSYGGPLLGLAIENVSGVYKVYLKLADGEGTRTFDYAHKYLKTVTFTPAPGVPRWSQYGFGEGSYNSWAELYKCITVPKGELFLLGTLSGSLTGVWTANTGTLSLVPAAGNLEWNAGDIIPELPAGFVMLLLGALGTGLVWFRKKLTH